VSSSIIGLGTALPTNSVSQIESYRLAKILCCHTDKQERVLEQVYKKSGIQSRSTILHKKSDQFVGENFFRKPLTISDTGPSTAERMAVYEQEVEPLASQACRGALYQSGIDAETITHLVTVSCTGFYAPGFDLQLFKSLSLKPTVRRTHIGFMGCHGALNGLRVANSLCAENSNNVVLICATELCSMHFQYGWSKESLVSNSLFADGSAALLMRSGSNSLNYADEISYVVPDSEEAMSWRIGDAGFIMSLANYVPELIRNHLPPLMTNWLSSNGLAMSDVKGWAVHPGGPRILDAVENALKLDAEALSASRAILAECGNMSSPTVLFILQRLLAIGDKLPCVILGFGPGLTVEAALIR
jgi:predicted naringenin-chalcone synthase